ncbi:MULTISPECIES: spore germination protein [Paenibacillus]|uniref:spore germination protein n=1 Tax=Paenibacillus TaxID=44249 RepID=UPI00073F31D5|nr:MULTISPECIES: spore germination protein [Paenibacillus]MDU4695095.1 spore germination protein [Paenibacillus sp.]
MKTKERKEENKISRDLAENVKQVKSVFQDCSDVVYREIQLTEEIRGLLVYIEGIIKVEDVQQHILRPLIEGLDQQKEVGQDIYPLSFTRVSLSQAQATTDWPTVINGVLTANVAIFMEGMEEVLLFSVKGGSRRSVQEPQTEAVIRGPREGFTESLRINTALVRFKIKTEKLKLIDMVIGKMTKTDVAMAYIDGVAEEKLINDVKDRLESIDIDGILESGYIEEWIEDNPSSPFPQMQYSERPDSVAAQLLEGRIAIFVDGTPFVLIAPVTLWQLLQASEDYYERFFISNMIRWIRIFFLFLALFLPSLYIAVTTFHQDMLPSTLILSIAASREAIPFPALVEAFIMEISFEALREAGIRLPKTVGQAVSILGALVIGQAAVQAGIVSAPMVIVVSLTGIASFTIPRFSLAVTVRMLRFPIMLLASAFGLFGIVIGAIWIVVHLTQLKSFGVPYMNGVAPYDATDMKDIFSRVPMWKMNKRPSDATRGNVRRIGKTRPMGSDSNEGW